MSKPKGIIPAVSTAYNKDGSVDDGKCRALGEWLIDRGVHGLTPNGTSAEPHGLSPDEHRRNVRSAVSASRGRVPVYSGIIAWSTKFAINMAKAAVDEGATSLMVMMPFSSKPSMAGVFDHLRAVSKAVDRPLILYNNPVEAGYELSPEEVKSLVDEGVLYGMKSAHGGAERVNYTKYLCGDKLSVLYGNDFSPLEAFAVGADGWLAALPTALPELCVELYEAAVVRKDLPLAQEVWSRMVDYCYYFNYLTLVPGSPCPSPHFVAVVKATLKLRGLDLGGTLPPVPPLTPEEQKTLEKYWAIHQRKNAQPKAA